MHFASGVLVLISGTLSGIFVVTANAWMNTPAGIEMVNGVVTEIRPFEAMFNPSAFTQTTHMTVAAFVSVGFAVAAVHAFRLLKDPDNLFHRKAFAIALAVAASTAPFTLVTGHMSAEHIAHTQPSKLAAAEGHWETEACAPFIIGGIPDAEAEVTRYAIKIPCMLSLLAHMDPNKPVTGLKDIPEDERPPVVIVHFAFQLMIALGMAMIGIGILAAWLYRKVRGKIYEPWFLKLAVLAGPFGFLAVEAGWFVTEVGRQPWIIRGIMRTEEAVTGLPMMMPRLAIFTALYVVLAIVVVVLLRQHVFASPAIYSSEEAEQEDIQ
jgi:cytochrome d ubiquinol oxidase subunit I